MSRLLPTLGWCLLLALCAWAYWPGLSGPTVLDDAENLRVLTALDGNPAIASDVVWGNESGPLGRPISMLSFTLERLYWHDSLFGIKRTNLLIHLLIGSLFAVWAGLLLRQVGIPHAIWLAIAAGGFWLLAPLFVSTVLYAVQRMAQLSTLYALAALLAYTHGRQLTLANKAAWPAFLLVPPLVVCAVLAKENGVLAVPLIFLLEACWFQFRNARGEIVPWLRWAFWGGVAAAGLGALVLFGGYGYLLGSYSLRDFTLAERLFTEARILWDYVGQFFLPNLSRLGVVHDDIVLSSSWREPVTTLYALLGCLAVALASVWGWRYPIGRLLAFCPLFFLAGHAMESTILPLELYFEHRNYLPAMGVVLLPVLLVGLLIRHWPQVFPPLAAAATLMLVIVATQLASQAFVWSQGELRTLTSVTAHPNSPRANVEMAVLLAEQGALEEALDYSARADSLQQGREPRARAMRELVMYCLADTPVEPERLAALQFEVEDTQHRRVNAGMATLVRFLQEDNCPNVDRVALADRFAENFLGPSAVPASGRMYTVAALLENHLERYEIAYAYMERLLARYPGDKRGLMMQLYFASALQRDDRVRDLLQALQSLQAQGKLNRQEQINLSYFQDQAAKP